MPAPADPISQEQLDAQLEALLCDSLDIIHQAPDIVMASRVVTRADAAFLGLRVLMLLDAHHVTVQEAMSFVDERRGTRTPHTQTR